jgi:amino acid adenylation domain-containing protein
MASIIDVSADLTLAEAPEAAFAAWPFEPFPAAAMDGSVADRFDAVARRYPGELAASDRERSLTYSELRAMAASISGTIAAVAEQPGPVAILLANEARYAAAMLGVLAAGRAYVPLDAHHPIERNRQIAEHAEAAAVVSAGPAADTASAIFAGTLPVIDIDSLHGGEAAPSHVRPRPDDIANITYTSGSTGRPKGVYQNHRGLLHDIMQSTNTLRLASTDRTIAFHSPSFLHGTRIVFGALLNGGSVHMLRPSDIGAAGIADEIRARRITVFRAVATLFTSVAATLAAGELLDSLRLVYLGGDRVTWGDFDAFRRACRSDAAFGVHLSSTECSTVYLQWLVDERRRSFGARLPIGRPLPDRAVGLLDEGGSPVEPGEVGEFAVTSRHVALGYWREPDLTARAFKVDPDDPAVRTYRTGDLGRRRPDGLYEFVGRKDVQVKLHGHRIEPGEVEAALRSASPVRDAAVVVRRNSEGVPRSLVGYVELRPGTQGLLPRHLLAMAAQALPAAMVPAMIVISVELPRLANLKIDRARLAEIDAARAGAPAEDTDRFVRAIVALFEQVLNLSGATPDDSVATLGGNSLHKVEIALELERRFGIRTPVGWLSASQSIRELATRLGLAIHSRQEAAADIAMAPYGARFEPRSGQLGEVRASTHSAGGLAPLVSELNAAFAEKRPIAVDRSEDLSKWASALDILFLAGRLDVLAHSAAKLSAAYPGFDYAETIATFFDRMPPVDRNTLPFADKRLQSIQVVARPGSPTVILAFCDRYHGLGAPLAAIHRWLGTLPASLIYLRDFRRLHFLAGIPELGQDREHTIQSLRRIVSEIGGRRVLCYGNSAGSFAALDYGEALGAEAVLAVAGPTNLRPEFNAHLRWMRPAERIQAMVPGAGADMRDVYAAGTRAARVRIAYGEHDWDDRLQAENLTGLPRIELKPVAGYLGHNIAMELIRRGGFGEFLEWLVGRS